MNTIQAENGVPYISTDVDTATLASLLKKFEPWRHKIVFSNGLTTEQFARGELWTERPLAKILKVEGKVDLNRIRGGRALDIGCNSGYNSLYVRSKYGMTVKGIDFSKRHIEAASLLAKISGVNGIEFIRCDANTFREVNTFDLILHLGTLYHLKHPMLSLENCAESLREGAYFILETMAYEDDDPLVCKCLLGATPDNTNWWAIGRGALKAMMETVGLRDVRLLDESKCPQVGPKLSRLIFVAEK